MKFWLRQVRNRLAIWMWPRVACGCGLHRVVDLPGFAVADLGIIHTNIECRDMGIV